jgi:hypothetical protein
LWRGISRSGNQFAAALSNDETDGISLRAFILRELLSLEQQKIKKRHPPTTQSVTGNASSLSI